ncbi:hypothetical protein, partial [Hydrogenivirga sp. 128-5-R1-1]|uniref:hypothetical protein n=1 Tax=Hydrogenivirga sp. 128-5-R1-1 TaxID=392423 RepID=UPI0005167158
ICKKEIYVPFNNFFKNIFLNADILTWDILVAAVNINNLSSIVNLYKFTKQKLISPTSFKQIEPYKTRVNLLIERFNINENWLNQNNKEPHFYVPSEFYSVDSKNEFLKRVFYYIFYIGQIKYLKKDKKPLKIISLLSNSGVDFQRLKKQKGFPFIEYKLFSALEKVSDYFSLDINEDYKNFEQFLESKIYISPTKTYREFIGNVLKRKNVV